MPSIRLLMSVSCSLGLGMGPAFTRSMVLLVSSGDAQICGGDYSSCIFSAYRVTSFRSSKGEEPQAYISPLSYFVDVASAIWIRGSAGVDLALESGRRQGFGRVIARRCSLARVTARSRRIHLSRNMTLLTDSVRDCDAAVGRVA